MNHSAVIAATVRLGCFYTIFLKRLSATSLKLWSEQSKSISERIVKHVFKKLKPREKARY